jgi:hypothetical protein
VNEDRQSSCCCAPLRRDTHACCTAARSEGKLARGISFKPLHLHMHPCTPSICRRDGERPGLLPINAAACLTHLVAGDLNAHSHKRVHKYQPSLPSPSPYRPPFFSLLEADFSPSKHGEIAMAPDLTLSHNTRAFFRISSSHVRLVIFHAALFREKERE